ncbi:hypothetical protein ACYSNU_07150 [Enterococcus sp. LJL120]
MKNKILLTTGISMLGLFAFANHASAAQTMNRLYNPYSGEHFYTASTAEKINLVNLGWKDEGIGWTAPNIGDAVYRLYNPNSSDHHYTTSLSEYNFLSTIGWKQEGIGWYSSTSKEVPLYRLFNPNVSIGTHHYTISRNEVNNLVPLGWQDEGIGWYGVNADNSNTIDKTKLQALVDKWDGVAQGDYTLETYNNLINALNNAKSMLLNADATQYAVWSAESNLNNAVLSLKTVSNAVDKTKLQALVDKWDGVAQGDYTSDTYNNLVNALNNAKSMLLNANATQYAVWSAESNLNNAVLNLKIASNTVDKTRLQALVDRWDGVAQGNYSSESYSNLINALNNAKSMLLNADATQYAVWSAESNLNNAALALN